MHRLEAQAQQGLDTPWKVMHAWPQTASYTVAGNCGRGRADNLQSARPFIGSTGGRLSQRQLGGGRLRCVVSLLGHDRLGLDLKAVTRLMRGEGIIARTLYRRCRESKSKPPN